MTNRLKGLIGVLLLTCGLAGLCAAPEAADTAQPERLKRSWVDLARYSGQPGSAPVTQADFRQLVFELQAKRAARATGPLPKAQRQPYEAVRAPRNNLRARLPLSVLHWNRDIEQLTTAQLRQARDTGVAPVPVLTNRTVFAFAPLRPTTYRGGELSLALDPDDLFEEVGAKGQPIVSLRVDAGDGGGWRGLTPGQGVAASYASTGAKTLQLEAVLGDGSVLSASAPLDVRALFTPQPTETVALSGGQLYVYKSGDHAGLRCPVFVVEGFDMRNDMDWDALYNILNEERLAETLRSYGRDLVVLDFTDAMADIREVNAGVAIDAINHINAARSNGADKFTVIGASMGGLVSRNALARMDNAPAVYGESRVDTWISFDSPQEGANIPLGCQQFFSFFGAFAGDYPDLAMAQSYRDILDSVAAKQMLLCHYSSGSDEAACNPAFTAFQSAMKRDGYPTACKKIAIINGSGYGVKQAFSAGQQVIQWHYDDGLTLEIGAQVYALYKSANTARPVFYGRFDPWDWWDDEDYTADKRRFYPYSLDNAAGGTRASFQELFDKLPTQYKDGDDACAYATHCFIPAASALGLPSELLERTIHGDAALLALSPFDEVHYPYANEPHIDINPNNKAWFMKAVLEGADADEDGVDDYQEYVSNTDNPATNRVEFAQAAVTAAGEGDAGSGAFAAVAPVYGVGPVSVSVYVLPGSASTRDYVSPGAPLTLMWAAGEAGTKEVSVPIRGDRTVEGDEVFYLALGAAEGGGIGAGDVCAVTIPDDDRGVASDKGVFVTGLPRPPEGGKVLGAKYVLPGKTVTLSAQANDGWTFLRWEDGSQAASHVIGFDQAASGAQSGVLRCSAIFKKTAELAWPVCANPGPRQALVGCALDWPLTIESESLPKVTVTGLPTGVTYDADAVRLVGVPAKAGTYAVTVKVSNPRGAAAPQAFTLKVDPLPAWAQGAFSGYVAGGGSATLSVTAAGKVTGKVAMAGTNYAFSAASYAAGGSAAEGLSFAAVAKAGKAALPLTLTVAQAGTPATLSVAAGTFSGLQTMLWRDVWKDAAGTLAPLIGYYTATLPGDETYGSGYLTFTVDQAGKVKVGGKLADGTAVSLSGALILDESGRVFKALYTAPAAYKGGGLFGLAEFAGADAGEVYLRPLGGAPFLWRNLSPQATGEYGAGFARGPGLTGGWYGTTANLYSYYQGKTLAVGTDADAPVPELAAGAARETSVWWDPDGLVLAPVFDKNGLMTGLAAPQAGAPTDADKDGAWDYGAANAVGLKVSLKPATGVFTGSFLAWFDYPVNQHVSRRIAYAGVLTPEREDRSDGVAGRGFFLWPDKAVPPAPAKPYGFTWSYDLKILMTDPL